MRRLVVLALIVAASSVARAESYLHQHVRVERSDGHKVVGEVIGEDDDFVKVRRGKTGWATVPRDEIDKIVSLEDFWKKEILAKEAKAKTADDWWEIVVALEKEGFDRADIDQRLQKILKIDPNHEKARKKLGYVKRKNDAGQVLWLTKKQAEEFDKNNGAITTDRTAQDERPWAEYRIVVAKPDKRPEYEIITNLPKPLGEDYANFMVELKRQLTTLIEKEVYGKSGKKIQWLPNPCQICHGNNPSCPRCGGSGAEPCTIFITNNHKMFLDLNPTPGLGGYYMPGPFPAGDRQESYGYVTCSRPIVAFHGQFGGTGNTFMVLSHEGTHQLEHRMWKGDASALMGRPGWLTEGLACYFGDGLVIGRPDKKTGGREMHVDIARDRLAALKRRMKAPPGEQGNYTIKQFTNFGIREFQQDPGLYSCGWALIYFMLNSPDKFKWNGKDIDLKEAFGAFFSANCEKGALEEYQGAGMIGLCKALGLDNPKDVEPCLDALDKQWRDYVMKLPIKAVGDFDKKDKKKWVSSELKFEISLPGGRHKPKFNWSLMSTEDLNSVIFDEAMAFTDGNARAIVAVHANTENYDIDDALEYIYRSSIRSGYGRYASTDPGLAAPPDGQPDTRPDPVVGALAASGLETRVVTFKGKENKVPGFVENPRPNDQKVKMLVCCTATSIYQVILTCDEADWPKYEKELDEILASFAVKMGN